ncbi:MAG: MBL fold metallo-hydrolase [Deltaproteobacteria bacterium]|nr:MBL fold metallo-hydrolase [Deltaproteobacteria bacterium]MBW2414959.1 MBL fold metallo-hydrolase [Deltaproteobacteria bacterium]
MSAVLEDAEYGEVTVHYGARRGKYPHGNSLVVHGGEESIVIDPSLGIVARAQAPPADRVVNSHCHEDHVAGNFLYPDAEWWLHEADVHGMQSLDCMMDIYGYPEPIRSGFEKLIVEQFHYVARPDAVAFRDGDVMDLGGGVRVHVIHTPGHTRGHCAFLVEPSGLLYLGDIDLSSFGPYYGDAWSDLEDFAATLVKVRDIDARYWATFHHIGVLETREAFLERLDRFTAMIADRERRLLEYLAEPHSLAEIAEHRFVFRPGDDVPNVEAVESRSMGMHVDRLLARGALREVEPGRFESA